MVTEFLLKLSCLLDFIAENKSSFERTSSSPELSEILPRPSLLNVNNTTNDSLKDDEACNHKAVDAKSIQNTISKQIAKARQKLVSLMGVENKSSVRECKLARSTSKVNESRLAWALFGFKIYNIIFYLYLISLGFFSFILMKI